MQIRPGFRRFDGKQANTGSYVQKTGSILKEGAETGAPGSSSQDGANDKSRDLPLHLKDRLVFIAPSGTTRRIVEQVSRLPEYYLNEGEGRRFLGRAQLILQKFWLYGAQHIFEQGSDARIAFRPADLQVGAQRSKRLRRVS
jgi:hypothetical protein